MLTKESRENLKWALKATLLEQASKIQVKEARVFVKNFILKEATYEQLLNLAVNPHRDERYLDYEKLEQVAKITVQESLQGKKSKKSTSLLESFLKEEETPNRLVRSLSSAASRGGTKVADIARSAANKLDSEKLHNVASAIGDKSVEASKKIWDNPTKTTAIAAGTGIAAAALAGFLVYRKMRAAGKSKQEAATAAAAAETNPDKKRMWAEKAAKWQGQ